MDTVGKMHFGEFNPLDVLAAAASLQSAQLPDTEPQNNGQENTCQEVEVTDEDETANDTDVHSDDGHVAVTSDVTSEPLTVNDNDISNNNCADFGVSSKLHIVSVLNKNASTMGRKQSALNVIHVVDGRSDTVAAASDVISAVTMQVDSTKQTLTTTPLKATVLQTTIGRFTRMITDHSYTFLHRQTDASRTKTDEDEGYCSRSSLDSPSQGSRSDSDAWDQDVFDQRDGENKDALSCRIISRQNSNKKDTTTPVVLLSPPVTRQSPCEVGQCSGNSLDPMPVVMVINGCKVIQDPKESSGCDSLAHELGDAAGKLCTDGSMRQEGTRSTGVICDDVASSEDHSTVEPTQDDTNTSVEPEDVLPCVTTPSPMETTPEANTAVIDTDQFEVDSTMEQPRESDVVDAHKTTDGPVQSGCKQNSHEQEEHDCIMLNTSICAESSVDTHRFPAVESMDCSGDKNGEFPEASVHLEPHIASGVDVQQPSDCLSVGDSDSDSATNVDSCTDTGSDTRDTSQAPEHPVLSVVLGSSLGCVNVESSVELQPSAKASVVISTNETNAMAMDTDCVSVSREGTSMSVASKKLSVIPGNGCTDKPISCDDVKSDSQETSELTCVDKEDKTLAVNLNESTKSLGVSVVLNAETKSETTTSSECTESVTGSVCSDVSAGAQPVTKSDIGASLAVVKEDAKSTSSDTSVLTDSVSKEPQHVHVVKFDDDVVTLKTPGCVKTPSETVSPPGLPVTHKSGHQYIIEDDVSPVAKFGLCLPHETEDDRLSPSTTAGGTQQDGPVKGSDAWKLLGTYDQAGVFVSNSCMALTQQKHVDVYSVSSRPETTYVAQSKCDVTSTLLEFCGDPSDTAVTLDTPRDPTDMPDSISTDDVLSLGRTSQSEFESLVLQTISDVMPSLQTGCRMGSSAIPKINNCDDINAGSGPPSLFGSVISTGLPGSNTDSSRSTVLSAESSSIGHVLDQCSPLRMSSDLRNDSNDREVATLTLADGRITPVHQSPSMGLRGLEMSPCEQINIKIAGGKVVGMNLLDEGSARKATTSIGTVGSLQWTSLPQVVTTKRGRPATKSPYSVNSGSFIPIPDNRPPSVATLNGGQTQVDLFEGQPLTTRVLFDETCKNSQSQCKTLLSARTCHMYMRKKLKQQSEAASKNLGVDLSRVKQSAETILQLHPLIDHDYCMFTEFSADIQSSIIATTESKLKTDKKYTKKTKAARTTKSEPFMTPTPVERVPVIKLKKRKYVRRKGIVAVDNYVSAEEKKLKRLELVRMREAMSGSSLPAATEFDVKRRDEKKLSKTKLLLTRRRSDRNYVKITGSYQDEFVYFATKKTRGRPRKAVDANDASQIKLPPVSGVNVFDWYRDLSKTDKSSRFGMLDTAVDEGRPSIPSVSPTTMTSSTSCSSAGHTPIHESEVVDLVMDLMPSTSLGNNKLFMNSYDQTTKGDLNDKTAQPVEDELVELNMMAEQVRMMLNSMGEAELKMWEEKLSSSNGDKSNSFPEVGVSQGETPTSMGTNLPDLDDINDNDLLSTDIGNMTVILGDLTAPKPASGSGLPITPGNVSTGLPAVKSDEASDTYSFDKNTATLNMLFNDPVSIDQSNGFGPDLEVSKTQTDYNPPTSYGTDTVTSTTVGLNGLFGEPKLDRYELFPDIATSDVTSSISSTMSANQSSAPELTVVSMFWNDLPGLTIRNKKYVRLVDIHKQILPAKDTGILKKRCQMMGLEVANCSELERDFLIRYANAVKSKSTVIIPQDAAQQLIGFYVNPRPRMSRFSNSDDHGFEQMDKCPGGSEVMLKPRATSFSESRDGESEAVAENGAMHEKAALSQLVDSNGHIRQIIIGRRKYGRSASRRKRKASTSSDMNKQKRRRMGVTVATQSTLSLKAASKASVSVNAVKRSTRMKYEKGHYVAMLQGLCRKDTTIVKDDSAEKTAVSPTHELEVRSGDISTTPVTLEPCKMARWSAFHANRLSSSKKVVEELELRKMRTLQKKRRLTSVEKLRMKKLRERLRKKMMIQEPLRRGRKQKLVAGMVAVAAAAAEKHQRKLALKSKKLSRSGMEHCYAAAVETPASACTNVEVKQPQHDVTEQSLQVIHCAPGGDTGNCSQVGTLWLSAYVTQESVCVECNTCGKSLTVGDFLHHQHQLDADGTPQSMAASPSHTLRLHSGTPISREMALWQEFENRRQAFSGAAAKHIIDAETSVQPDRSTKQLALVATPVTELDTQTTRHSKRVRKRKQLHPIERYVFSKLYTANEEEDGEDGEESSVEVAPPLKGEELLPTVATPVVSSRTKLKVTQRRDSKAAETRQQKYGLRTCSPEDSRKRRRL